MKGMILQFIVVASGEGQESYFTAKKTFLHRVTAYVKFNNLFLFFITTVITFI